MQNYMMSAALMLLMSSAAPVLAQDNDREDEIVTTGKVSTFGATKSDIPILETARSVEIVTDDMFIERGALTLDDTLNYSSGVIGDSFGFSTRGDFAYVRGLDVPEYLDNIQVLFGFYNNARSDIYTLEQVEVLKGPASVLYGAGSPGGILNTVSKRASADYQDREIVLQYGNHDRRQISTDIGFNFSGDGRVTGRLVGVYRDSDTQIDFVKDDAFVVAPSLTYQDENTVLTLLVNHTERESDSAHQFLPLEVTACRASDVKISGTSICDTAPERQVSNDLYVGDPNFNRYDSESSSATLFLVQAINDRLTLESTARLRENDADYRQSWLSFTGSNRVTPDGVSILRTWYDNPGSSKQFATDTRLRSNFLTGALEHEVLAGINYQDVTTKAKTAYVGFRPTTFNLYNPVYDGSEIPDQTVFDAAAFLTSNNVESVGYYINDQIEVGAFVVNAGLRYDESKTRDQAGSEQKDDAVSLSAGLLYRSDFGLNPYISYAESFNPVVGNDLLTGNSLKPQEGEQVEIGVKYKHPQSRSFITASYFDVSQTNLPNPAAIAGSIPSQQEGEASITGFEVEAQTVWNDVYFDATYSTLDTKNPDGQAFQNLPEDKATLWMIWKPETGQFKNFRAGGGVRYLGETKASDDDFKITADSNTILDATVGYTFKDTDISLNVRNLMNEEYYANCLTRGDCFPGEERTVVARLARNF